jgi:TrmH family RNA methyltransferase
MITSTSNQQIKNLIQLQSKAKVRGEQGAFVIEGIKMFEESKAGGHLIKAYVSESFYMDKLQEEKDYFEFSYEIVSDGVFKEASDTMTPQGIMAIVKKPEYKIEDLIKKDKLNLMLLEDLRDPGNLGTIIRTSEGAGFDGVILSKASVDVFNPKVIRSTMGAIYRMPIVYVDNFLEMLEQLKAESFHIYAAHLKGASYYDKINYGEKTAILIGNEANGLSEEAAKVSNHRVKIPMEGQVESLNAAIAAGILMYEVYRQRRL